MVTAPFIDFNTKKGLFSKMFVDEILEKVFKISGFYKIGMCFLCVCRNLDFWVYFELILFESN